MSLHPLLGKVIAGGRVVGVESHVAANGLKQLHAITVRKRDRRYVRARVDANGRPIEGGNA